MYHYVRTVGVRIGHFCRSYIFALRLHMFAYTYSYMYVYTYGRDPRGGGGGGGTGPLCPPPGSATARHALCQLSRRPLDLLIHSVGVFTLVIHPSSIAFSFSRYFSISSVSLLTGSHSCHHVPIPLSTESNSLKMAQDISQYVR